MSYIKAILLAMVFSASLFACSKPDSDESYLRYSDRDEWGRFEFVTDMADSTVTGYDIDIMLPMDCGTRTFASFENMPVTMMWMSPSGRPYEEKVWVTRGDLSEGTRFSKRFRIKYRYGIVPEEFGFWKLYVTVPEDYISRYNIPGIGLRLTRKQ